MVSVVMPAYNAGKHISLAIKSILNQSYPNFELLIVDDKSSDDTGLIVASFKDERIRFYQNNVNEGPSKTLNVAIAYSRGDLIAIMHADDIAHKDRLMHQVHYLEMNEKVDILGTQYVGLASDGRITKEESSFPFSHSEIKYSLLFTNVICHPTVMVRRRVFTRLQYNDLIRLCEDYDLWTRAILNGFQFSNLHRSLLYYRRHPEQASSVHQEKEIIAFRRIRDVYRASYLPIPFDEIDIVRPEHVISTAVKIKEYCDDNTGLKILYRQLMMNLHTLLKFTGGPVSFSIRQYYQFIRVAGLVSFDYRLLFQLLLRMLKK